MKDLDGSVDENLAPIPTSAEIFGNHLAECGSHLPGQLIERADLCAGRVQQLASEHQEELHRYVEDMNTTQGRMNHQLQVIKVADSISHDRSRGELRH